MNLLSRILGGPRDGLTQRRPPTPATRLQVTNLTRHTVLATSLEVANSGSRRSKGLLGRARLAPGEGLWILPCEAVHTFFMQFPIDLVYLDRRNRIRKICHAVPPWRLSACLSAHSVLELARRNHPQHTDATRRPDRILACFIAQGRFPVPFCPRLERLVGKSRGLSGAPSSHTVHGDLFRQSPFHDPAQ
jgi:uncharacterized membrane protein (UPF0127 family)